MDFRRLLTLVNFGYTVSLKYNGRACALVRCLHMGMQVVDAAGFYRNLRARVCYSRARVMGMTALLPTLLPREGNGEGTPSGSPLVRGRMRTGDGLGLLCGI
ncbi:MAG: hypothetical protein AMXMBFR7_27290 [Planctomycetota bacterium]